MPRRYATPITRALPDIGLPEPRVSRPVMVFARAASGAYLRAALGFRRVSFIHGERLALAMRDALGGARRVIFAVRHAYGDEAQLVSWASVVAVPRMARKLGLRLPRAPHAVFAHGYEVPRWGGPLIRFILPRVGAMPIRHDRLDSLGMGRIRKAIEDGPYPLAIAPEGQVSYTSDEVPRLEPGVMRLGFGAAERLAAAGRSEPVVVLPLSNHYRYDKRASRSLGKLVARIEAFSGTGPRGGADGGQSLGGGEPEAGADGLSARLSACLERLLSESERLYGLEPAADAPTAVRTAAIAKAALDAAERLLGIAREPGDHFARLYRVRREGWDRIYMRPGYDSKRVPPLRRALTDRAAGEAWYSLRHMELADLIWYLRSGAPPEDAPMHALVEFAQNTWDLANRLAGGTIAGRVQVRPKRAVVVVAEPIDLSSKLEEYRAGKKRAVESAMAELDLAFKRCVKETLDETD